MGFVRRVEIRRDRTIQLLKNFLFWRKRGESNGQELRNFNKIFRIVARVVVFPRPVDRDCRAEWKRWEARARSKEWNAALIIDSLKQDRPSLVCERVGHVVCSSITSWLLGQLRRCTFPRARSSTQNLQYFLQL